VRDGVGDDVAVRDLRRAQPGEKLELALDAQLQDKVENVLKGVGETYRPKGATAIVTNPTTGEILALANWPRINANNPVVAPGYTTMNRAVGYNYEPGSTFKAVTIAGALEDHKVTPETEFSLPPTLTLYDRTIRNAEPRGWETMSVSDILARSDNIGAITVAMKRLGMKRFDHYVREFGFGRPTGTDMPGEEQGFILPTDKYSGVSMGNLPIGQGELVTPMQIAAFYGAIANGGVLRAPHVVRKVGGQPAPQPTAKRVMSPATAAALRKMLKGVLAPGGTASEIKAIPGYELAGKTGTAQKIDPITHEYSGSAYVASFVGFAPALHPKLLISIMVDEPHGAIYGGQVAAPAFRKIAAWALSYEKIPPG
jgi:cell division protein FtsI/penicillin-binding protein 2